MSDVSMTDTGVTAAKPSTVADAAVFPTIVLCNRLKKDEREVMLRRTDIPAEEVAKTGERFMKRVGFSAFYDQNPNLEPIEWTDVYESTQGEKTRVAMDTHTAAIFYASIKIALDEEKAALMLLPNQVGFVCLGCGMSFNKGQPVRFCSECHFAAFHDENCALRGWAFGHKALCKRITATIQEEAKKYSS
jgi:hypothetical protein